MGVMLVDLATLAGWVVGVMRDGDLTEAEEKRENKESRNSPMRFTNS